MNLPNNLKDLFDYFNIKSVKDFTKFYFFDVNPGKNDWRYVVECDIYVTTQVIGTNYKKFVDFGTMTFNPIDYKPDRINLNNETVNQLISTLTETDLEKGFSKIQQVQLKDYYNLEIKNKYNSNSFKVSKSKFKQYSEFYYSSEQKITGTLILCIEFDQDIGDLVAKSINEGKLFKPTKLDKLIKYIDLMRYLLIDF